MPRVYKVIAKYMIESFDGPEVMAKINGKPKFDGVMIDRDRYRHSIIDGKLKIRKKESKTLTMRNMRRGD